MRTALKIGKIRLARIGFLAIALAASTAAAAFAQANGDAFSGFRTNNNTPIQIEADSLEVRDAEKLAVFKGNVDVQQGETTMKAAKLNVYYDGSVTPGGAGSNQGIRRIEATGKVLVTSGNNQATGDSAVFNMKSQEVVLTGNVILTQCDSIVRGKKLTVNLNTGQAQLSGSGRVQALFSQKQSPGGKPGSGGNAGANGKKCS